MTQWARRLESVSGSDFQHLLNQIKSPVYVDETILKSELSLLVTKVVKLLRSNDSPNEYYAIWKGCHTAVIICSFNPLVLMAYGGQLLAGIFDKLEHFTNYFESHVPTLEFETLLSTLVSSLTLLMDLMRKNPTLSREHLIPKLKAIIPILIKLSEYKPLLTLPVLSKLLYKHSTTFRPFANKYRAVLQTILSSECKVNNMDNHLKKLVCRNYAYLHLIKVNTASNNNVNANNHSTSSFPDENWRLGLFSVLRQYQPIFKLFYELLDMDQDEQLKKLINNLPAVKSDDTNADTSGLSYGEALKLDLNEPLSLLKIVDRIRLLNDLLFAFITSPTPFAIRVPMKLINDIAEILINLNIKYLSIKRELRHDQDLCTVIEDILIKLQSEGIQIWLKLVETYGKQCLIYIPNVINSLNLFIPLLPKSNNVINYPLCDQLSGVFNDIFKLINLCLPHLGHQLTTELDVLSKLIDVAMHLVDEKSLLEPFFETQRRQRIEKIGTKPVQKNKKKNKSDTNGTLSDLYTHSSNFDVKINLEQYDTINRFLYNILNNWKLSSFLQIRITKYAINKSVHFKQMFKAIPRSFVRLLRVIVINPGFERVSILPIAVSLLSEQSDDVFDVLCHPRLPVGIIYNMNRSSNNYDPIEEKDDLLVDELKQMEGSRVNQDLEERQSLENMKSFINNGSETSKETVPNTSVDESMILKRGGSNGIESFEDVRSKRVKIDDRLQSVEFNKDQPITSLLLENERQGGNIKNEDTTENNDNKIDDKEIYNDEEKEENEDEDEDEFVIPEIELSDDEEEEAEEN